MINRKWDRMARIKIPKNSFNARVVERTLAQRCGNYPPCIERIQVPSIKVQYMDSWDSFRKQGDEHRMQKLIKDLQINPNTHVSGYRRLRQHKVNKLQTTGWYTQGKTHPRYLGMDVK